MGYIFYFILAFVIPHAKEAKIANEKYGGGGGRFGILL
jgi:hypothetical protein